ncbi:N-acetylmuramoyl-L-alanine amidase [Serpentinicella sp. ANB-PHB4]|uniref:N-acetylmuramoyl-L-alanine amidase n=1 Tax=Serpentinicella sp. ANB-PHB4 TaxID=3074076 RepID=UPI0028671B9A|nr:N-acetylmuramoyl-L-alanine amidase [Serpentinicella sp. ANB-PHB4]MDR5659058.1 N-acetylmuramoyl-L-alanine amidase [Serpentinicella sp. ANB-PHB4]
MKFKNSKKILITLLLMVTISILVGCKGEVTVTTDIEPYEQADSNEDFIKKIPVVDDNEISVEDKNVIGTNEMTLTNEATKEEQNVIDTKESSIANEVKADKTTKLEKSIDNKNIELTNESNMKVIDYLLPEKNSRERTETITHIMIHFISNVALNPQNPYKVDDIYKIFDDYGVSAHYMICRDGEIYRLVPEDRVAYHAGSGNLPLFPEYENKLNDYSIGIELLAIGTKEEMLSIITEDTYRSINPEFIGYTDDQYNALNNLLNDIHNRLPSIPRNRKHVVGHDEYAPGRKTDPGILFDWTRIGY